MLNKIVSININFNFDKKIGRIFLSNIHFMNSSGVPPHKIELKVGVPVMLIRNIYQEAGLCNRTRLHITILGKHFFKSIALNRTSIENEVLIWIRYESIRLKTPFQNEQASISNHTFICDDN